MGKFCLCLHFSHGFDCIKKLSAFPHYFSLSFPPRSWKRLRMTTTVDGNVSVRAVAKTFASGKTEKLVHQTLAECGLPSGKVSQLAFGA